MWIINSSYCLKLKDISAICFLLSLYALSLHPGWSMSSSGSNFVSRWLQLSRSLICLGNQGPVIFSIKLNYHAFNLLQRHKSLLIKFWWNECLNLQLKWLVLLQDASLTSERELLLLKALMKLTKFVCLISILNIASICGFLLLLVP